jgi:hypothetical protein
MEVTLVCVDCGTSVKVMVDRDEFKLRVLFCDDSTICEGCEG